MSVPNRTLALTELARGDLEDILAYTLKSWGDDQRVIYRTAIDRVLRDLLAFPMLGAAREDLAPGCRMHRVREHLVIYRVTEQELVVLRIVHRRTDLLSVEIP